MTETVSVDLGQGIEGERLTITIDGAPCRIQRARDAVFAALVEVKSTIDADDKGTTARTVAPCWDKSDAG